MENRPKGALAADGKTPQTRTATPPRSVVPLVCHKILWQARGATLLVGLQLSIRREDTKTAQKPKAPGERGVLTAGLFGRIQLGGLLVRVHPPLLPTYAPETGIADSSRD